ncbi:hypothetical protein CVT25_002124 [Psilocybe cyanescens]|uniref:F-box domain-containing protein n=1 Tax=Psilocybe cyanescens TaxID=93625 RepID=A0A409XCI4_PSICY|nr:hypothetical protein CVT25_002124 [Psilocybe cyanescens]
MAEINLSNEWVFHASYYQCHDANVPFFLSFIRDSNPLKVTKPAQIDALPFELLSQIFFECVRVISGSRGRRLRAPASPWLRNQPYAFKLVSKRWSDVAVGSPHLWNYVSAPAYDPRMYKEDPHATRKFVLDWLVTSLNLSLHLRHHRFDQHIPDPKSSADPKDKASILVWKKCASRHRKQMLDVFLIHEKRWESLEITFDLDLLQHFNSQRLVAGHLGERLSYLQIVLDDRNITLSKVNKLLLWVGQLCLLQELDLDDPHDVIGDLTLVPWQTLTKIIYRRRFLTFEDSFWILRHCTFATDISIISGHGSNPRWPLPSPPSIAVPQPLCRLAKLSLWGVETPLDLLKRFSLPRLESLEIKSGFSTCSNPSEALSRFLDQSQCQLKRVVVSDIMLTLDDYTFGSEHPYDVYANLLSREVSFPPVTSTAFTLALEILERYRVADVLFKFKHKAKTLEAFLDVTGILQRLSPVNFRVWKDAAEKGRVERPYARYCVGWEESQCIMRPRRLQNRN